jgi:hypothetical protein
MFEALVSCVRQLLKALCFLSDITYTFIDCCVALWRREKREAPFHSLYDRYYATKEK